MNSFRDEKMIPVFHLLCILKIRIFMTILPFLDEFRIRTYEPIAHSSMELSKTDLNVPQHLFPEMHFSENVYLKAK